MKSTGIVRKVDDLGRIVIPKEMRRTYHIDTRDSLEIFVDGSSIILKKYTPACILCDSADNTVFLNQKHICRKCIERLAQLSSIEAADQEADCG